MIRSYQMKKEKSNPTLVSSMENQDFLDTSWEWQRSLEFSIPGARGKSGLHIKVSELQDGRLHFELSVMEGATPRPDIQALFFNVQDSILLESLIAEGEKVTAIDTGDQIDVGYGQNVRGQQSLFDVGIGLSPRGKDGLNTQATEFTLATSEPTPLTLDDIGGMDFGVRINAIGNGIPVITEVAPHAPDAVSDSYVIFEDGTLSLDSPSKETSSTIFNPLDNDTDNDGDTLTIVSVRGAEHGLVEIIDGDDPDNLPGDAIRYTPNLDYSGEDSFEYLISDTNGGQDFSQVEIEIQAVADKPVLSTEILATQNADQMILKVYAEQADLDVSEYIDRIELIATDAQGNSLASFSNYLNEVVYNPVSTDASVSRDFYINLPSYQDTFFNLHINAISKEISNGDEETSSQVIAIETVTYNNAFHHVAKAVDQSIWSSGDVARTTKSLDLDLSTTIPEYDLSKSTGTFGFDIAGFGARSEVAFIMKSQPIDIDFKLENNFTLDGGSINADIAYTGSINSIYNKTVDQLQFETNAKADLANSSFTSFSPTIAFETKLAELAISGGVNLGIGYNSYVTLNAAGTALGTGFFGTGDLGFTVNLDANALIPNDGFSIAKFDGTTFSFMEGLFTSDNYEDTITDYLGNEIVTYKIESPNFNVRNENYNLAEGTLFGDNYDPFLTKTYDIDGIASSVKGIENPVSQTVSAGFDYKGIDILDMSLSADILDFDLFNPYSFSLNHKITTKDVYGKFEFEDGSESTFKFGDSLLFDNASIIDQNGNNDGNVDYNISLLPNADLQTTAGIHIDFQDQLDVLKAGYSLPILGERTLGPAFEKDGTIVDRGYGIPAWSDTFTLNLNPADINNLIA